jgi:hypothetical protein
LPHTPTQRTHRARLAFALSAAGYAFTAILLYSLFAGGIFTYPGADAFVWDRVGDEVRAGISPYYFAGQTAQGFFYAPPWAILFAALSWLPIEVTGFAVILCEVAALRYIAGSWLRVGYLCWFPLVPFELAGSQWNIVIAAAIAAAMRGRPLGAVVTAAAKFSPALAIDPRQWRQVLVPAALLVAVTLPWWHLWPEWIDQLRVSYGRSIAITQVEIPLLPRAIVALALALTGRPVLRGLAAIIAIPAIYWISPILLLALVPARSADHPPDAHLAPARAPGERGVAVVEAVRRLVGLRAADGRVASPVKEDR